MLRRWTFVFLLALSIPVGVSGCVFHRDEGAEHHAFRRDDDGRGYYAPGTYSGYYAGPGDYAPRP